MSEKKEETASFVLRFTQKIFESENGDPQIQWRGHIRHVQTGEETRFTDFGDANQFVQSKLSTLTIQAVEHKSMEEQEGIMAKSIGFWKKVALAAPKLVLDSIKDPKKQVAQIQEQIQDQIQQVGESLGQKLEIDDWRASSKSDFKTIVAMLEKLTAEVQSLKKKK